MTQNGRMSLRGVLMAQPQFCLSWEMKPLDSSRDYNETPVQQPYIGNNAKRPGYRNDGTTGWIVLAKKDFNF
ncbi:hypothetical protein Cadr_000026033 [Camelus dromedarius]|uniref:Uncharacterized protein n=1 Tax=Camelus dromedarius TaxID=9838 RepID=A0A5N4CDL7_CAMDR|nr:hypothetical protein Cadr_000026033 [Camelus dromedarius]